MSRLEDRLRDAYRSATDTVAPETIRGLHETVTPRSRSAGPAARWRRLVLIPLGAAAVVTVIAVLAAVVLPRALDQARNDHTQGTASATAPKFLIDDSTGAFPLEVRSATTGTLVAQIAMPAGIPSDGDRTYITDVATADGRHYLVAFYQNPCRSWVYKFQLNGQGQPSTVTPFTAVPPTRSELYGLTVSRNGQMVGYTTTACMGQKPAPASYVAVTNVRTGKTTQWSIPATTSVEGVSLTADGSLLCYSLQFNPSMVGVISTGAAPGSAADRGRTVVRADQFGASEWISYAAISPDGKSVYFTTYVQGGGGPWTGQVRVVDLATGRSRVIHAPAGQPGLITADPSVQHLLLQIQPTGPNPLKPTGPNPLKLARLDLATGAVTYLPSAWIGSSGAVITW
jgi:hypothetical protein